MKTKNLDLKNFDGLNELSIDQLHLIDGGGFWYDISYVTAVAGKLILSFAKDAVEYQHSLPPNLKKQLVKGWVN